MIHCPQLQMSSELYEEFQLPAGSLDFLTRSDELAPISRALANDELPDPGVRVPIWRRPQGTCHETEIR
jgi:hypothetical protein